MDDFNIFSDLWKIFCANIRIKSTLIILLLLKVQIDRKKKTHKYIINIDICADKWLLASNINIAKKRRPFRATRPTIHSNLCVDYIVVGAGFKV